MEQLNVLQMTEMLCEIADKMVDNEQLLCQLDSHVGDGDHGITVARGFAAVKKQLKAVKPETIGIALQQTGDTLSETMGGAIGPIVGEFFGAMGEQAADAVVINTAAMADMLAMGLEQVMLIGGAKPGDRTLVDALSPAVSAVNLHRDAALPIAMQAAADAAEQGVLATKEMVAKKGRAKFLQEKSLGYQDAGATSMYLVLATMANYCTK